MKLKEIVAIAGVSGLHKIIGRTKNGLILETLAEPKKRFPTSIQDRVSVLEDIAMYTVEGDMRLAEVLVKINEKEKAGTAIPTGKDDAKTQRNFLIETIQLDSERVYDSDIKKLITWYGTLKTMLDFATLMDEETPEETAAAETAAKEEAPAAEEKPKAKKAAAKTGAAKTKETTEGVTEEKAAPKAPVAKGTKKAKAEGDEAPAKPKATKKKKSEE